MLRRSGLFQKADERILGNGDFVEQALDRAKERLDPAYDSIALGYDFNKIVQRVADLLDMSEAEVLSSAKRRAVVKARSMVCYSAYQHLGIRQAELARRYCVSLPAVWPAVQNGRKIIEANGFELL
jgi:putative transposase